MNLYLSCRLKWTIARCVSNAVLETSMWDDSNDWKLQINWRKLILRIFHKRWWTLWPFYARCVALKESYESWHVYFSSLEGGSEAIWFYYPLQSLLNSTWEHFGHGIFSFSVCSNFRCGAQVFYNCELSSCSCQQVRRITARKTINEYKPWKKNCQESHWREGETVAQKRPKTSVVTSQNGARH